MATTKIINDLIDLNQTGNTTALKGCVGTNAQQPTDPTISVEYLVVGGGGGANGSGSGGGGAGGFSTGTIAVPNNTAVNIVIGQGGLGVLNNASDGLPAGQGQDSGFYTIQGQGGGAGVHRGNGLPGGSGGGGGNTDPATAFTGGSGVSSQGNNGGSGTTAAIYVTGGGGGAGAVGTNGISSQAGAGGVGSTTTIISTTNATTASVGEQNGGNLYFAGGGGGGGSDSAAGGNTLGGSGGLGGGGDGTGQCSNCPGGSATLNTGGGGGGSAAAAVDTAGGSGGSGVVILKYASTATETIAATSGGFLSGGGLDSVSTCNYPTTAAALYQFENTPNATCGPNPSYTQYLTYNAGVPQFGSSYKALYFKGGVYNSGVGTEWLSSTAIIDSQQDASISFWVNFDAFGTGYQYLSTFYATGDMGIFMDNTGSSTGYSKIRGNVYDGGSQYVISQELVINTWYHVVFTRSTSSGMVLYIDGLQVDTNSSTIQPTNHGAYNDSIGCYGYTPSGNRANFDGQIDQFRAFQSALTSTQVEELYNES